MKKNNKLINDPNMPPKFGSPLIISLVAISDTKHVGLTGRHLINYTIYHPEDVYGEDSVTFPCLFGLTKY